MSTANYEWWDQEEKIRNSIYCSAKGKLKRLEDCFIDVLEKEAYISHLMYLCDENNYSIKAFNSALDNIINSFDNSKLDFPCFDEVFNFDELRQCIRSANLLITPYYDSLKTCNDDLDRVRGVLASLINSARLDMEQKEANWKLAYDEKEKLRLNGEGY